MLGYIMTVLLAPGCSHTKQCEQCLSVNMRPNLHINWFCRSGQYQH